MQGQYHRRILSWLEMPWQSMWNLQKQIISVWATHLSRTCHQWYQKSSKINQTTPRSSSTLDRLISCTKKLALKHFIKLLNTLTEHQDVSISGPIACYRRGKEAFSQLLSFNTWLASICHSHKLRFIDNFNIFWNCGDRLASDGLHPNYRGSRLLTANISHALLTSLSGQNQAPISAPSKSNDTTSCMDTSNPLTSTKQHLELSAISVDSLPEEKQR